MKHGAAATVSWCGGLAPAGRVLRGWPGGKIGVKASVATSHGPTESRLMPTAGACSTWKTPEGMAAGIRTSFSGPPSRGQRGRAPEMMRPEQFRTTAGETGETGRMGIDATDWVIRPDEERTQ